MKVALFLLSAVVQVIVSFHPVVSTKDMPFMFFTWLGGWNTVLLSNLHPAGSQGWIKASAWFRPQRRVRNRLRGPFFQLFQHLSGFGLGLLILQVAQIMLWTAITISFAFDQGTKTAFTKINPSYFLQSGRSTDPLVQIVKSYPTSAGSFSITSPKARLYASSAFGGRPLLG